MLLLIRFKWVHLDVVFEHCETTTPIICIIIIFFIYFIKDNGSYTKWSPHFFLISFLRFFLIMFFDPYVSDGRPFGLLPKLRCIETEE